jgi:hypothetical protein
LEDRLGFLNHPMALPASALRSAMEFSLKNQGLELIDHARLAAGWSNDQIRGLQDYNGQPYKFAWPPLGTYALLHNRDDLRFLASLGGRLETLVRQGSVIPLAALSKAQQRAVVEALDSVWYIAPSIDLFTESEFAGGAFQIISKSPLSPPRDFEMIYSMGPPSRAQETRTIQLGQPNPSYMPKN